MTAEERVELEESLGLFSAERRLEKLRTAGWAVAVHNDYRLDGKPHTFWLLTHPCGRWEGVAPISGVRVRPLAWPAAEEQFRDALERELALKAWEVAA